MKIAVIGTGYVGLVTGACLAKVGVTVTCIDIDENKINNLNNGVIPIYEPGLTSLVKKNVSQNRLFFSTSIKDNLKDVDAVFIAVGTPPDEDGSADLKYVLNVARDIGQYMNDYLVVITKSTVPIGTAEKVRQTIQSELDKRSENIAFDVASNPEFLREGDAINDFLQPDRIVIGVDSKKAEKILRRLYQPFIKNNHPVIFVDIPSSEMIKYAANSMLATRISFMNEIANLCERVGANVDHIKKGIGTDTRIGSKFLNAGVGYGGSCFPKDVKALIKSADSLGYDMELLKSVEKVNESQKSILFSKILKHYNGNIKGLNFALWGLSFKPQTDDMREASALVLIDLIVEAGANIIAYDPIAIAECKRRIGNKIKYVNNQYDVLKNTDALIITTEWDEFKLPKFTFVEQNLKAKVIFDGRNIYSLNIMKDFGYTYYSIGRKDIIQ